MAMELNLSPIIAGFELKLKCKAMKQQMNWI